MAVAAILKTALLAITHQPIVQFQRNFVWGSRTTCRQGLHDKNWKFLKSKMADGRHFKNRKIAISPWKIVRFLWNLVHCIRYWTRWQSRVHLSVCLTSPWKCRQKRDFLSYELWSLSTTYRKSNIIWPIKFKMADGQPYCKSWNRHVNEKSSDFDEIGYTTAHLESMTARWPNMKIFEIQDGEWPAF